MKCNMRSNMALFVSFFLLFLSHKSFARDIDNNQSACPKTLAVAAERLNRQLNDNKWILIDYAECQNIQSEILESADTIVQSNRPLDYIPFMSKETLRLIRNTFFALKGYKFNDDALFSHFKRYSWYKPLDNISVTLSPDQKRTVELFKKIEDNWQRSSCWPESFCRPPQPLPLGVNIIEKEKKTFIRIGKTLLDITPTEIPPSSQDSTDSINTIYSANGVTHWNAVVLCQYKQPRGVDLVLATDISIYSVDGTKLSSMGKMIESVEDCPFWNEQRPNILMSYSHRGCCGAISDILATFDRRLNPVAVIDCPEDGCRGTNLFYDPTNGDPYFHVSAGPTLFKTTYANGYATHVYESTCGKPGSYINSIWRVEKNGSVRRVAEVKRTCHGEPIPDNPGWSNLVCDEPEGIIALSAGSKSQSCDEISTSIRWKDRLVVFKNRNGSPCGTMVIPISK